MVIHTISFLLAENHRFFFCFVFVLELLLIAIPTKRITLQDAKLRLDSIVRNFEFSAQLISLAFLPSNFPNMEFDEELQQNVQQRNFSIDDTCSIIKLLFSITFPLHTRFEDMLLEPHYMPLPKEGQLRIDDALSEMEAMDYRDWNDEPLKSLREFYVLGSALYFRKYLLASHLSKSDLLDVEAFLRVNGIYTLIENKPVTELIIWREIYPKSVNRGRLDNDINDTSSRFELNKCFIVFLFFCT